MACRIAIDGESTRAHAKRQPESARRAFAACVVVACCAVAGPVEAASNVVQYRYDAVGNIVAIERVNAAPVTLSSVSPSSGPIGTAVAIIGTGFSPTISTNAVTFNGAAATVVAASATSLTAVVPTGATTGQGHGACGRQCGDERAGFRRDHDGRADDRQLHAGVGCARARW